MRTSGMALDTGQGYRDRFSESTRTARKYRKASMAQPLGGQRPRKMTGGLGELGVAVPLHPYKGNDSQGPLNLKCALTATVLVEVTAF